MRRLVMLALSAVLLLTVGLVVPVGAMPQTGAVTGTFTLTVDCTANPERTTITNNTDETFDLSRTTLGQGFTLGSLYQPRSNEPFRLAGTLAPGVSITFETGSAASNNALSRDEIYNNQATGEGARLVTPFGGVDALCSARTGTLRIGDTPMATAPTATGATTATTTTRTTTTMTTVPGLPNTGGGGMADPRSWGTGLAVLLGTALAVAVGVAACRRHPTA